MRCLGIICFFLCVVSGPVVAQDWLKPVIGDGYGVQVKEGRTSDAELDKIKDAGLGYVRFVIPWYEVEKGKGSYVWGYFDQFVERLREKGLKAVIVLSGGHPVYTGYAEQGKGATSSQERYPIAPSRDDAIEAFARFAAKAAEHFGGNDLVWEIWNEPDTDRFWTPHVDVETYIKLARKACLAMREVQSKAHIIGPGMADMPWSHGESDAGFLGPVLRSDLMGCFDAISLHPYRDRLRPPELVLGAYERLALFMKSHAEQGKPVAPVLSTEWGFTLTDMDEAEQAAFLLRSFLLNTMAGVPLSIWYEWRDSGSVNDDPEDHFGLLYLNQTEKMAYKVLRDFLPPLKGAVVEKQIVTGTKDDYVLLLKKPDGNYSFVFWSSRAKTATKLLVRGGQGTRDQEYALTPMPVRVDLGSAVPSFTVLSPQGLP